MIPWPGRPAAKEGSVRDEGSRVLKGSVALGGGGAAVAESACQPFPWGAPSGSVSGRWGRAEAGAGPVGNVGSSLGGARAAGSEGSVTGKVGGGAGGPDADASASLSVIDGVLAGASGSVGMVTSWWGPSL